jgi:hypothetical protein
VQECASQGFSKLNDWVPSPNTKTQQGKDVKLALSLTAPTLHAGIQAVLESIENDSPEDAGTTESWGWAGDFQDAGTPAVYAKELDYDFSTYVTDTSNPSTTRSGLVMESAR